MELLYIGSIVTILGMQGPDGLPTVTVDHVHIGTEEFCYEWRDAFYSDVPRSVDPVTGSSIIATFFECTPYPPDKLIEAVEEFRSKS